MRDDKDNDDGDGDDDDVNHHTRSSGRLIARGLELLPVGREATELVPMNDCDKDICVDISLRPTESINEYNR